MKDKNIQKIVCFFSILALSTCFLGYNNTTDAKRSKGKEKPAVQTVEGKQDKQEFKDNNGKTTVVSTKPTKPEKPEGTTVSNVVKEVPNIFKDVRGIKTPIEDVPIEARQYAEEVWNTHIPADAKFIYIDKMTFKLYLIEGNKVLGFCDCALGKNPGQKSRTGDMTTPHGVFPIEEINDASWWSHDFKDGRGEIPNAYGPWFIYLNTYALSKGNWDGIGIHGTNPDERFVRTVTDDAYHRASEGCIRLLNDNVLKLKEHAKPGMKVVIKGDDKN